MFHEPYFPKSEFDARYERAWLAMGEAGVQAIIAYNPGNMFWLTGFMGSLSAKRFPEFAHHAVYPKVLLPAEKDPVMIGLNMPTESYAKETHVTDIRPVLPPVEESRPLAFADALKAAGIERGKVGIDLGAFGGITVPEFELFKQACPNIEFVDVAEMLYRLRMIKSEREIGCLRTAVDIQNNAFRKFVRRIGRGISETELMFTLINCQAEAGATEVGIAMPWTHPGYTFFRAQYPDRLMEPGDFQWIDGGSIFHGYSSDYDIILVFGEPSKKQLNAFDSMRTIYREALELWKPGTPIADISKGVLDIVKRHGEIDPLEGRFTGHNLGYEMVERPWFGIGSPPDLKLEVNMVIAPEWFIKTPFGPILFEENFIVGEQGLERLTDFPSKLQVIAD